MTLKKCEKIKNYAVFRNLKSLDLLLRTKFFILLAKPKSVPDTKFPQIAFIVSKKTIKLAVHRNKAKRRLGEAYRSLKPKLQAKLQKFQYLVFLLNENITKATLLDLINCLERLN